jgi:glycosyltransferase involved in cell wall biosynthesis
MPKISIIIRTKNESRWITHCLEMVFNQDYKDKEVVIVDNNSSDHTIDLAQQFPISKVLTIDRFVPGEALNLGIAASSGEYIVCLSAHCIPKKNDWLKKLYQNFIEYPESLAGVYGRQLPICYTPAQDKRDLLITFGRDKRIQKKDYFFHNANSMIKRSLWEKFPFDDIASNIEDRIWGKKIVDNGYFLLYEPDAEVYHHHGIHQGNPDARVNGVVSIIEKLDKDTTNELPESLKPGKIRIDIIIPVLDSSPLTAQGLELLQNTVERLSASSYITNIFVLSHHDYPIKGNFAYIRRSLLGDIDQLSIDELLAKTTLNIEEKHGYASLIGYFDYKYLYRYEDIDNLISYRQYGGFDTVFIGYEDYGHYWVVDNGNYMQINPDNSPVENRSPSYVALYGQGCIADAGAVRTGNLISGKIGIYPTKDSKYKLRINKLVSDRNLDDNI